MTRTTSLATMFGVVLLAACSTDPPNAGTPSIPTSADGGTIIGNACTSDEACGGLKCTDGKCYAASASDGTKNDGESDVDCGGPVAPPCADGKACAAGTDCASVVCAGGTCAPASPTDAVKNADETDVDCGGAAAPKCVDGKACRGGGDCESAVCKDATCAVPAADDGVKNADETDVDCGGTVAAKCAAGKACKDGPDCDSRFCTDAVCEPRKDGRKDGDETDVDCGGVVSPKCDWGKGCLADTDCTSTACGPTSVCVEGPSCKVVNGGTTCGTGEVGQGGSHESCCRSLPVSGYTDPRQNGKTVYVDKYEITAGRMRAFLAAVGAAMGGPNVKSFMAARRPARWNNGWENTLPSAMSGQMASFTTQNPTIDLLYPGQDQYLANNPTQPSWSVGNGTWMIDAGIVNALGASHFFPEYITTGTWPAPDYAASHGLNCSNTPGSYGYPTYWFDAATTKLSNFDDSAFKTHSQDVMDTKALNCTPFGLFAALCAWDGGQIVTSEVMDYIGGASNTRFKVNGAIPACANGIVSGSDASTACVPPDFPFVYFYPGGDGSNDGASRVAAPGRVEADVVRINANDEGWHEMKGNLLEAVLRPDGRFDWRGYGLGYGTAVHHRNQQTTPRMKGASFGARCMRFR
jgi:hypothetical protein